MYLKSIEVQGFKSFANKIVFEFHNGITGIVGPNGSGKSNVADAVRWVLGEQKVKQLRGGSMQDVIFAGTELRKPQGFAHVSITLDNKDRQLSIDFDEVTVSRRLYRSGESEYMMNGSICRLKDINELFYDTGIGKEGYSIIGQGQIDKILSGKPEDRRELFDEAAGIVKFKRRKVVAQKKLEDEKQNLLRVTDILTELERQVGPLKRQSEAAREYLGLKEELKTYDVNLFLTETAGLRAQLTETKDKENMVSSDLLETKQASDELKTSYEQVEMELSELEQAISNCRSEAGQADMLKGNLEGQINVLHEQINTENMHMEHIEERIQAITNEISVKESQIQTYQQDNAGITEAAKDGTERLEKAEEALRLKDEEIMLLDHRIEEIKAGMITALNEKAALNAREQRFEAMLEQIQVRRAEVNSRLLRFKTEESIQEEQLLAEQKKLEDIRERLFKLSEEQTVCETDIAALEKELKRLEHNLSDRHQEYHTGKTKLESLRNIAERYEGYGNSIRRVMDVKDRVRGIHGVVADLITTDKRYEVALETALGGSIQNVVTDSEQTAKQLIEYLKKNKYGRVTFLPLTSIGHKGSFNQKRVLDEDGVIGLASELVDCEPEYEVLAEYLLGRVVVVDNIDHAIALARKYQHSLRIVTLEGELLNAGGSMTGGAFKNSSNLLGRKREMEELENLCQKALKSIDSIQKELTLTEGQLLERREELGTFRQRSHEMSLEENTVAMNTAQLEEKKADLADSAEDLKLEYLQLEQQLKEIEENRGSVEADADKLTALNDERSRDIETMTSRLEKERIEREDYAGKLSEIRLETANLKQKVDFVMENIHRVEAEIETLEQERNGLSGGTESSRELIEIKTAEIVNLKELIAHALKQKEQLSGQLEEQTAKKDALSKKQKEFFTRRDEMTGRITVLDRELLRLQTQQEKLEERLEHHVNYMWAEYELTFSTAEPLANPELTSIPSMKKHIDELKGQIRALGNINVNAIEDYKEISERYEFMKTQYDDLTEAEETLLGIIQELDTGMRSQFEEKFREIKREFDRVFKELFGGGHGTLDLVENEDILEAGIQIIAQPPGKKLQNMMQLSGGEKALTAISLLFAIQNLKPSPFCLLDEIEAALDDSNVDRFAGYLHKLTKNTQFIVITHRRGTMETADRLYGITMQEKGVSTLVSVNLIEDKLDD